MNQKFVKICRIVVTSNYLSTWNYIRSLSYHWVIIMQTKTLLNELGQDAHINRMFTYFFFILQKT